MADSPIAWRWGPTSDGLEGRCPSKWPLLPDRFDVLVAIVVFLDSIPVDAPRVEIADDDLHALGVFPNVERLRPAT